MSTLDNGRILPTQNANNPLQKNDLAHAGAAANRAATEYLFADYRQRRASKTIRTQTAALLLWVQYLHEVNATTALLAAAETWVTVNFADKTIAELHEYMQLQQISLPIMYGTHYGQQPPAAWRPKRRPSPLLNTPLFVTCAATAVQAKQLKSKHLQATMGDLQYFRELNSPEYVA